MKSKKVIIVISVFVICVIASFSVITLIKNSYNLSQISIDEQNTSDRGFYLGISGYTPTNFPNSNVQESIDYWDEINLYAEVYGVHVDWQDTALIEVTSASYDGSISLVLGYQDPAKWGNEEDMNEFLNTITKILNSNSQIKYLAIGNEVNVLYEENPERFKLFVEDYHSLYNKLKESFPELYIYTTFNYESLIGEGYLFGESIEHIYHVDLLDEFQSNLDLIGLTVYPYFDYKDASVIPENYFKYLDKYEDIPLAITETGWMSRSSYGDKYSELDNLGLSGSEQEQSEYLDWLLQVHKEHNIEFINWIFLNDPQAWKNGLDPKELVVFDSIGLKNNSGESKKVWQDWQTLFGDDI